LILFSSFGEFYLFYKNLGDVVEGESKTFWLSVKERSKLFYDIISKKKSVEGIQHAIIAENALAIVGVITPIFTSLACKISGLSVIDLYGQIFNGIIQGYMGYMIIKKNTGILVGRSVSIEDEYLIKSSLYGQEEFSAINEFKTEYIGDQEVRIYLKIIYNSEIIGPNLIKLYEDDILKLTQDQEKIKIVKAILMKSVKHHDEYINNLINNTESKIKLSYPDAKYIDLELSSSNIKKEFEEIVYTSTSDGE
jgi:hypothetical protein